MKVSDIKSGYGVFEFCKLRSFKCNGCELLKFGCAPKGISTGEIYERILKNRVRKKKLSRLLDE